VLLGESDDERGKNPPTTYIPQRGAVLVEAKGHREGGGKSARGTAQNKRGTSKTHQSREGVTLLQLARKDGGVRGVGNIRIGWEREEINAM